ncbi:glycosyltransferase [Methylomonas methanica]|uniref:glycosyltransferase n=1 Tax=Methylomonas methanica TaxID=421 RepID=UPI001E322C9D|nr:glycosyltransferase [Methylomonas methanica]
MLFALKDLEYAEVLLAGDNFAYLQAPMRWPDDHPRPPASSYPGLILNAGFTYEIGLLTRAKAWQYLYQQLNPDLIVFDHAPTALLAAHGFNIPRAGFGNGFFSPPRISPMPNIRPWFRVADKVLSDIERQVLNTTNSVLARLNTPPLRILADLFEFAEDFICTFPELDHYKQWRSANYWGPTILQTAGIEPIWPSVGAEKIFAYLHPKYPGLEALLKQLRASPWSILVHIPGTTPAFIEKNSSANLHITPQPVMISAAAEQCDLAICHGGVATLSAFLLRGKPLLTLPFQIEQLISAQNAAALGAGAYVTVESKSPNFKTSLTELFRHEKYSQAARQFAEKYAGFSSTQQAIDIAARCETLMTNAHINGNN